MRKTRVPLNAIGQRFGRLVIVGFSGYRETKKTKSSMWLCKCDCGNYTIVKRGALTSGNTKSCGCLAKEKLIIRNRSGIRNNEIVPFNNLYRSYKNGALKRGLEFSLSRDDFKNITKQRCYFCGIEPLQEKKTKFGDKYVYNGIDRINNSKGYVLENCVPCCKVCNYAKSNMRLEDFYAWIRRLANKNKE